MRGLKEHWHIGSSTRVHEEVHLTEVACEHPPNEPARVRQPLSRERGVGRGEGERAREGKGWKGMEREGGRGEGERREGERVEGGKEREARRRGGKKG